MENLEKISEEFSFDKEKEIARSFSKRFQWEMALIGVGQATVWLPARAAAYVSLPGTHISAQVPTYACARAAPTAGDPWPVCGRRRAAVQSR